MRISSYVRLLSFGFFVCCRGVFQTARPYCLSSQISCVNRKIKHKRLKTKPFFDQRNIVWMGNDLRKLATRQAMMGKFAQPVAFIQQAINSSLVLFWMLRFVNSRLALTFLLVAGLCGCGNSGSSTGKLGLGANVTPIREIKPRPDNQTTVYIQGRVSQEAPLIKQRVYQIDDTTGKIWVVTNQTNIQQGQQVVFKGKVRYRSIPLAGKEFGEVYLEEE
jgi:hypothetical protein